MYDTFADLWRGFAKNVYEGMGSPGAIGPWTVLLVGGQVMPWLLLPFAGASVQPILLAAVATSMLGRALLSLRFRQGVTGALVHPVGVLLTMAIQWYGLFRWLRRRPVAWKGRVPV